MKIIAPTFLLAVLAAAFTSCMQTQPMPSGPDVSAAVEAEDGGRGDVPSVNHPNLDPGRNPYRNSSYGASGPYGPTRFAW